MALIGNTETCSGRCLAPEPRHAPRVRPVPRGPGNAEIRRERTVP
jgi:hypothetical protein